MKQGTAIVPCKCEHDFQDRQYGRGNRVANSTQKAPDAKSLEVRCTVCKTLHRVDINRIR